MAFELGNNPYARAHRELRSWPAVLLLMRVKFLTDNYGREWVTRSREDWGIDLDITLKVYKTALALLVKKQFVETRRKINFNGSKTALKLSFRGKKVLDCKESLDLIGTIPMEPTGTIIKKEGTLTSSSLKKKDCALINEHAVDSGISNPDTGENMPTVKELMNTPGALKKTPAKKLSAPELSKEFEIFWKERYAAKYPKEYQVPFTGKQRGHMHLIVKACPTGKAADVIGFVVTHWIDFVEVVKQSQKWKIVPSKPDLYFLLANISIAINMAMEPKPVASVVGKAKSVVIVKKTKPVLGEKVTLDEILSKPI
jgi:hypothetical protein